MEFKNFHLSLWLRISMKNRRHENTVYAPIEPSIINANIRSLTSFDTNRSLIHHSSVIFIFFFSPIEHSHLVWRRAKDSNASKLFKFFSFKQWVAHSFSLLEFPNCITVLILNKRKVFVINNNDLWKKIAHFWKKKKNVVHQVPLYASSVCRRFANRLSPLDFCKPESFSIEKRDRWWIIEWTQFPA